MPDTGRGWSALTDDTCVRVNFSVNLIQRGIFFGRMIPFLRFIVGYRNACKSSPCLTTLDDIEAFICDKSNRRGIISAVCVVKNEISVAGKKKIISILWSFGYAARSYVIL